MDPRITDILRYSAIFVVILVGSLFVHKHYRRYVTKKEIVALSKCDALDDETLAERFEALKKASRKKPLTLSAVSGQGMKDAQWKT